MVLGSLLEFKKDEEVTIFHLLQPFNKGMGLCIIYYKVAIFVYMFPSAYGKITKVTDQYCIVKLTSDDSSSLHKLVQEIYKVMSVYSVQ